MIYYSRLLREGGGNTGNALFEIASCIGLANRYNTQAVFPENSLFQYFKNPPETVKDFNFHFQVEEKTYKFDWGQWDDEKDLFDMFDINIKGWLQDSRYWEDCKEQVVEALTLKDEFVSWIRAKHSYIFCKPTIGISIRRGDYVDNASYELLPIRYYLGALLKYFPDFRDNYNIAVFSDDLEYCKLHFGCLSNVFYIEGTPIEQHCLGRMMDNFIISNSTFAYWMAYLGNPQKVITPKYLFSGKLLEEEGDVNFWGNEGWTEFDHKNYKIDLSDTTFTIPCFHDHSDREENLTLTTKLLKEDFVCNIIVGENQSSNFSHLGDRYIKFNYPVFHRTRMLNQMAHKATTPIIVNWDADVNVPPLQLLESVRLIRSGYDMIYPYDGRFARVPRTYYQQISNLRDVGILTEEFNGTRPFDAKSVGGAITFNKKSFISGGMENENFKSYGPEDKERFHRFTTLGFKVDRVPGILYHIDHKITINSSMSQPNYKENNEEWKNVESMSKEELSDYVSTWDFTSRYDQSYHEDIFDKASAKIVLRELEQYIDFKNIIDIGCGNRSWDTGEFNYTGVDHNVPNITDIDIRKPFEIGTYDLCISLEVAEHLEERYADKYLDNLCSLSDYILFSAAIPGQGGENHYNEQWQSYWADKFKERGFSPFHKDIRKSVWNNEEVSVWYRQNMVLYKRGDFTVDYELDVVHPKMYRNLLGLH